MKVLFMCTHNSCRSILSEAVFNHLAPTGLQAVSSGSFPSGRVNPQALKTLKDAGIATDGLSSKASDAFADEPVDIVITVCDNAAGEVCPAYFGRALKAHWGLADPSAISGSQAEIEAAFASTLGKIEQRIAAFIALNFETLSTQAMQDELNRISRL